MKTWAGGGRQCDAVMQQLYPAHTSVVVQCC